MYIWYFKGADRAVICITAWITLLLFETMIEIFSWIFFCYRWPRIQTVWGLVCRGTDDNSIARCQDSYDWPSRRWIYGPRMRWDLEFHVQSRGRRFRTSAHPRRTDETLPNMWRGTIFYNVQRWHVGVKNSTTIYSLGIFLLYTVSKKDCTLFLFFFLGAQCVESCVSCTDCY